MRARLTAVLALVVACMALAADDAPERPRYTHEEIPLPAGARVSLEFDKDTFFLG